MENPSEPHTFEGAVVNEFDIPFISPVAVVTPDAKLIGINPLGPYAFIPPACEKKFQEISVI